MRRGRFSVVSLATPSLRNFLTSSLGRMMKVRRGRSAGEKMRILSLTIVQSTPMSLRRQSVLLNRVIGDLEYVICRNWVVQIEGMNFAVIDLDTLSMASADYEAQLSPYFHLEKGQIFVDIGANIGRYTIPASRAVGKTGAVLAIEAHPRNYGLLTRNVELNKLTNVVSLNFAAWNANGELKLHTAGVSVSHSVKVNHRLGEIRVKAKRMDDAILEAGLPRVDLVKIDTEGAEIEVLQGMQQTLGKYRPRMIVEVWTKNLSNFQALMNQYGYHLDKVTSPGKGAVGLADNATYFAY